eukprot:TRINITY_DN12635_c0_g1_i1.p1 TRINITY_DN12635_c0_g1~~TRINITY_DN12635_c0_g1_i1.p1  ORF type:complete len:528 (+),score=129.30 TRINITY_DN12635_c0_g1_i1:38-1585(+)
MPSKRKETANKLHTIRAHEKQYNEGVKGVTSYFTPSLVEICAKVVADTFPDQPRVEMVLRGKKGPEQTNDKAYTVSGEQLLQLVTYQLSTDLPLDVCVRRVTAEAYWKARCEARWAPSSGQLPACMKYKENYSGKKEPDWKRTYLERHIEEFMMSMEDDTGEPLSKEKQDDCIELSKLAPEKVTGMRPLDILEMLCKLAPEKIQILNLDRQRAHLDWVAIVRLLPKLTDLRITFSVLDIGMNFRLDMFGVRKDDIVGHHHDKDLPPEGLVKVLRDPAVNLTRLALPENQIDDEKVKGLLLGLIRNETIDVLDLSHNKISDDGARALSTLLMKPNKEGKPGQYIRHLDLSDNLIGSSGGKALGRALTVNAILERFSLKLNKLSDEGGVPIITGLASNTTLKELNLSSNSLGPLCSETLSDTLKRNDTLVNLYFTGNQIGEDGAKALISAARQNNSLTTFDLRATGASEDQIYDVTTILKQRTDAQKRTHEAEKEREMQETTEGAVKDWKERFYLGE